MRYGYVVRICSGTFDVHLTTVDLVLCFVSLSFSDVFLARYPCMNLKFSTSLSNTIKVRGFLRF